MTRIVALLLAILGATFDAANVRLTGFLTLGCGDSYLKAADRDATLFVQLSSTQRRDLFRLSGVSPGDAGAWVTLAVVLEGTLQSVPKEGFFATLSSVLMVDRVVSSRWPSPGETVEAATEPARRFAGYALVGPESFGFVPLESSDEIWWVVPGKVGWGKLYEPFRPEPHLSDNALFYNALVEVVGRVGPPGTYGHLGNFNREIGTDAFKYIRIS